MKIIKLFCLTLTLVLAGCNLSNSKSTPTVPEHPEQATIRLNTLVLAVKKPADVSWHNLLPDWDPKKVISVVKGKADEVREKMASSATVSTTFSATTETTNMIAVPISIHDTDPAGPGFDMVIIPGFRHTGGPMTLSVDLHIQDTHGSFGLNQIWSLNPVQSLRSLNPDQSLLAARAIDENNLQVILITPEI
ncbi:MULTISPECIES: hypothetical protein [Citrobacter]|uniref:Lipoprotein n=1 Tax=Citrobacter pasteurii TaxID=1563222 RepID=A0ABX8KJL6_9ENTR|nr:MULTISPECIES: hypothetical protein [Citrobacter]QXA47314.1 hypothetical protein I6L54_24145 [Citrobacter pasteurii]TKU62661.1 hypothetical protein FDX05_06205 [Citrobacter sp. wls715]CEJ64490.1 hypothetical protein [Citrobacter pasteurii]HAT3909756.1 hypothetical protein [Citrobacter freundii]